jgi:hypothetical protein
VERNPPLAIIWRAFSALISNTHKIRRGQQISNLKFQISDLKCTSMASCILIIALTRYGSISNIADSLKA